MGGIRGHGMPWFMLGGIFIILIICVESRWVGLDWKGRDYHSS